VSVLAATAVLAGTVFGGLAAADPVSNPGNAISNPGDEIRDTRFTPSLKESAVAFGWKQVGGAIFSDPGGLASKQARDMKYEESASPTPHTVDFFSISFLNPDNGLAGGAACPDGTPDDQLSNCSRVPVIYRYARWLGPNQPGEWREAFRGTEPGYVGGVGWVNGRKAVAVGGSGCYPRREALVGGAPVGCAPTQAQSAQQDVRIAGRQEKIAGDARAWLLSSEQWKEIPNLPAEMTGLTALAFSPRTSDCPEAHAECGYAGGLGQIWTWKDGAFATDMAYKSDWLHCPHDEKIAKCKDAPLPPTTINETLDSPFRVRQIAITPVVYSQAPTYLVSAVTAGCCYSDDASRLNPTLSYPRLVGLVAGTRTWRVTSLFDPQPQPNLPTFQPAPRASAPPDSAYAISYGTKDVPGNPERSVCLSAVLAPGGPPEPTPPGDATSMVVPGTLARDFGTCAGFGAPAVVNQPPELLSVRLVAGGGDDSSHQRNLEQKVRTPNAISNPGNGGRLNPADTDGLLDWAVGASTGGEVNGGHRAAAYTTTTQAYGADAPYPLNCPQDTSIVPDSRFGPDISAQCQADPGVAKQLESNKLFALPSYALNAYTTAGSSGIGWAAGDRGALLRRTSTDSSAGGATAGDKAPKLGNGERSRLSDRQAYDSFRPIPSSEPGLVPALSAQPLNELPNYQVVAGGAAQARPTFAIGQESIGQIAMSRDGAEGWALGPAAQDDVRVLSNLYHFDGTRWAKCDPVGVPGTLPADPACAQLTEVTNFGDSGAKFVALARVPTENGGDRSNAGDFEAVAVAKYPDGASNPMDAVVRFRNGKWELDREWSQQLRRIKGSLGVDMTIAFGAPDDGWIVANRGSLNPPLIFRLKDDKWVNCLDDSTPPNDNPPIASIKARTKKECLDAAAALPISVGDAAQISPSVRGLRVTSAGTRIYLYGTRTNANGNPLVPDAVTDNTRAYTGAGVGSPVILSEDSKDGEQRSWQREYDPKNNVGCQQDCSNQQGTLNALSVARGSDGSLTGWGLGNFRATSAVTVDDSVTQTGQTPLLQLAPDEKGWAPVPDPGSAALEYLLPASANERDVGNSYSEIVSIPGSKDHPGTAVASRRTGASVLDRPAVWRNPASGRWEAFPAPFISTFGTSADAQQALITAMAPDNRGGLWLAAKTGSTGSWFYHFTHRDNEPVFSEVAHPVREQITASAAGGDGSFWVATDSGTVYRHDRLTGWDRVGLKGWDPGGVVQSPAYAIAVGGDGEGLVVGKSGRIAQIGPRSVGLDLSSVLCSADGANCATTKTLRAAAIAPDGSALAGGANRALIWRPPGGSFRAVTPPQGASSTTITSISLPTPAHAWLTTDRGEVMAGSLEGGDWHWVTENLDADGNSLARTRLGTALTLHGISLDANGHGYAVGDHGLILERAGGGPRPWRRLATGLTEHLYSVSVDPQGKGALIGGDAGLILTRVGGRFEVARRSAYHDPLVLSPLSVMGSVVGVGLLPGSKPGDVEAWATTQAPANTAVSSPPAGSVLHYTSNPSDPLLSAGAARVKPIPDAPPRQEGELDLAAFGKSDCQFGGACPELTGSSLANDVTARRIRDTIIGDPNRPDMAVFTGDANDVGGSPEHELATVPVSASLLHERWSELIADPFSRAEIPLYGALGGQDLSQTQACEPLSRVFCAGTHKVGLNIAWRKALAGAPTPWGIGQANSHSGLRFIPVSSGAADDAIPVSGARTHYAVDVKRGEKKLLRLVVLDTSLKTASGAAALQNPVQEQLTWLNDMLASRDATQLAVVVSETPSYAYNNNAGATTDTLADSAAFETVLVRNHVTAVISGRLGWNGLYWLLAPGLHTPCPGGSYQPDPPRDTSQLCQPSGNGSVGAADGVAGALEGSLNQHVPRPSDALQQVSGNLLANIPVAVAASAGGKFGPDGTGAGSASQGFWRGYTRVRLFPGKNLDPVIEQRPVFDWIGIQATEHTLMPGQRALTLHGYGREPLGTDQPPRYDDIDGPAITHQYDLVLADPARPYLPKVDPSNERANHYVPVPDDIGARVDPQTGVVTYSGRGNHPPIYALAILSVGNQAASWPLVLAPRRSFTPPPPPRAPRIVIPPLPRPLGTVPAALPPTPNTPIPTPPNLNLTFPPTPPLPNLTLNSPQTTPPPPPAPPPPPVSPAASALQLTPAPVGLNVAPAATVIPPPAPPIQPAPPGGARREARQRQAAAAKSEEGGDQGAGQESANGGDGTQAATRLDQSRDLAFTAHADPHQPSAWSRDLLYGGGLGIAALTLALGWSMLRPGPRRRQPELPAPAWSRARRR
jgi:hypothetical protein